MFFCNLISIKDGVVDENTLFTGKTERKVYDQASAAFVAKLKEYEIDAEDIESHLEDGYYEGDTFSVCLSTPEEIKC